MPPPNRDRPGAVVVPHSPHSKGRGSEYLVPRAGRYFLLITLVVLGIGIHRGINLLMLLGYAMLVTTGLNFWAARKSLRRLRPRRRFAEWPFARTPCRVEIQLTNGTRRARLGLRLEDGRAEQCGQWSLDRLPSYGTMTWRREVILPRRGRLVWGAATAKSGYPFGLVERRATLLPGEEIIVLPAVGWLHRGRFLRHLRSLNVQPQLVQARRAPHPHPAAQAEFHGLRSYRGGDSMRLIHWRTSARRGELMVREFEDEPSDNLLLVLDPTLPSESDYCGVPLREQFEDAIGLAATICWEWCRRHGDRLIVAIGGTRPVVLAGLTGPIHARRVLECLAEVECTAGPSDPAAIACLKECKLPPAIVVLVALGHSGLARPLSRALGRPVNGLDATRVDRFDFYTPPS